MNIYLSIGEADKHFLRKSIKSRLRVYNIGKLNHKKKKCHMPVKGINWKNTGVSYQGN